MAAHAQRAAWRLSSFCELMFIYLTILLVFRTETHYWIYQSCKNLVLDHPFNFEQLPPELIQSLRPDGQFLPTGKARGRRRDRRQRRGKRGGVRTKLRLNPHRTALPSIFLTNVRSLFNKLNELKIWTLTQKSLMDCNVMFFTETWLNNDIPTSVMELEGRSIFRGDRTAETTGESRGGGLCIYKNKT